MSGGSIPGSAAQKASLTEEYEKVRDKIKVNYYLSRSRYLIYHVMIPSSTSSMFYDVIFEFDLHNHQSDSVINLIDFKCFSNSPSFIYTYANIFKHNGFLCKWTYPKYERATLNKEPKNRNAYKVINFEKSLFLAAKHITSLNRNRIAYAKMNATRINSTREILRNIKSQKEVTDVRYAEKHPLGQGGTRKKEKTFAGVLGDKLPEKKSKNSTSRVKKTGKVSKSSKVGKTKKL